jgi:toxin YoeB
MISFETAGWEDYLFWQQNDKQVLRKINALIRDIQRDPFAGIGKPEGLKHDLAGFWSRRITDEHRLVYTVRDGEILIAQCRYHYE